MWDSKTVVGCCKLVCVLLYSTSTCYEEGLVNFLVDPIVQTCIEKNIYYVYLSLCYMYTNVHSLMISFERSLPRCHDMHVSRLIGITTLVRRFGVFAIYFSIHNITRHKRSHPISQ